MATPRTFPSIKPSARSYSPGTYPSTDFESLDGTKTHIRFGNKRVNATLTLGFSNITDAVEDTAYHINPKIANLDTGGDASEAIISIIIQGLNFTFLQEENWIF